MTNEITEYNQDEEREISYAEEQLKKLIEKSLIKMEALEELCEEMDSEPKMFKMWIECVDRLSVVLERLFKIQNFNTPKDANGSNKSGSNLPPITNALFLMNSADLLSEIESRNYGVKKRADLYLDE